MHLLVFDSGIGGLGVVREIRRLQPQAHITYLADNGFFPYGEKADAPLLAHILALLGSAIQRFTPDAVVIACNTASTIALPALRAAFITPFIGCVPPIKPAAAASKTGHLGVLATAATVRRAYLHGLIDEFAPGCTIHSLGTPSLAELAEQKFLGATVDVATAIAPLFSQPGAQAIDAIALGCTHYTFLLPEFQALYPRIIWCDPALPVARRTLALTGHFAPRPSPLPERAYFTAALDGHENMQTRLREFGFASLEFF